MLDAYDVTERGGTSQTFTPDLGFELPPDSCSCCQRHLPTGAHLHWCLVHWHQCPKWHCLSVLLRLALPSLVAVLSLHTPVTTAALRAGPRPTTCWSAARSRLSSGGQSHLARAAFASDGCTPRHYLGRLAVQPRALGWFTTNPPTPHFLLPGPTRAPVVSVTPARPCLASSLERQSAGAASCLAHTHSLCPGEPGLQTAAGRPFNLAEILAQNYGVREECEAAAGGLEKPEEELGKHFIAQSSDMPLDELLALYGYETSDPISDRESEGSEATVPLPDMTLDKEQIAKDLLSGEEEEETQSSADDLTPSVTSHGASDLFPNQSGSCFLADGAKKPSSSASSDTEEDPLPANKCKKEIMVGPQFQADLSNLHLNRHCEKSKWPWPPCAWRLECQPVSILKSQAGKLADGLCAWSEEECRNFEHGVRVHGKNFHLIQANKVRTRSVGECVEYYYLWKKSERYDYFSQQTRLGRRKCGLSGTTDADQDLDGSDPDGPACPRSSLSLPAAADGLDPDQEPLARMRTGETAWGPRGQLPSLVDAGGHTCRVPGPSGIPGGEELCFSALKWGLCLGPPGRVGSAPATTQGIGSACAIARVHSGAGRGLQCLKVARTELGTFGSR
ncbi:PREDICTED: mesoderm induction early response protein 2 [Condylura cristata]|uniref:mesoderm induction early response protein 2 n=1 Tax=Condylura cristata TaxID=143302 RepID=UPI000642E675|nr:PREDICTED: mesoderm induction early response protein 2 [Condylura cristata]